MSIVGIDHVQLAIPPGAEGRCRDFYVGLVGMSEIDKPEALKARGGLWLAAGTHQVHLGVESEFVPARKAHPALRVAGVDALAARLGAAGIDVRWADESEIPGRRRFFADDPLGNRLEFIEASGA